MALAGWLKVQLARLATRRGELELARSLLADGADLALTLRAQSVKPATLLALAELLEAQGHAGAARRVLAFGAQRGDAERPRPRRAARRLGPARLGRAGRPAVAGHRPRRPAATDRRRAGAGARAADRRPAGPALTATR